MSCHSPLMKKDGEVGVKIADLGLFPFSIVKFNDPLSNLSIRKSFFEFECTAIRSPLMFLGLICILIIICAPTLKFSSRMSMMKRLIINLKHFL